MEAVQLVRNEMPSTKSKRNRKKNGKKETTDCIFSQPDECRQLGLEVEDKVFWVSKESLCSCSPVFKKMLYGQFAESGKNVIRLPNKAANDVQELLLCLFPTPSTKRVDWTNVDLLLTFADEYELVDLATRCTDFLETAVPIFTLFCYDGRLLDILVLASKHRIHRLLFDLVKRCAECFTMDECNRISDQLYPEVLGAIAWMKFIDKDERRGPCNFNCGKNLCVTCGGLKLCSSCDRVRRLKSSAPACYCGIINLLKKL